ncbi:hypothetical protein ACELLULO517_15755 [Acidisoma cellulosilytica]|uniref:Uncharacterized protein n=1 Tax=Acidisoma cellulosilyticum TaxID=2802395 RepID=A0A964E579_9PROT|nr:hypothetical protein [Acidisoma cellulosilyticum]MCB8881703.1 hypothetical protein [Acidisoma cellulosilyticum]
MTTANQAATAASSTTPTALMVTSDFGTYKRGQLITDAAAIAKVVASGQVRHTVRVSRPAVKPVVVAAPTETSALAAAASAIAAAEAIIKSAPAKE